MVIAVLYFIGGVIMGFIAAIVLIACNSPSTPGDWLSKHEGDE
jgi:hypothetical protein